MAEMRPVPAGVVRLLLLGGGHANCQVVLHLGPAEAADRAGTRVELVLLSDSADAYYSGMVPACVAGAYDERLCAVHLPTFCAQHGWEFVQGRIVGLSASTRTVRYMPAGEQARERTIEYTLASLDVGSQTRWVPGAAESERCVMTRPISALNRRVEARIAALRSAPRDPSAPVRFVVAGSGTAGVELCFSLKARLERDLPFPVRAVLLEARPSLMPDKGWLLRRAVEQEARARGVTVRLNARVVRVDDRFLYIAGGANASSVGTSVGASGASCRPPQQQHEGKEESAPPHEAVAGESERSTVDVDSSRSSSSSYDGERLEYDLAVFATGPTAWAWQCDSTDLRTDARGFVCVRDTLQVDGHDSLFACGDCASMTSHDNGAFPPKAGVYAVRMGPVVLENLRRLLQQQQQVEQAPQAQQGRCSLVTFTPQSDFLSLIYLGNGRAIGTKWGMTLTGAAVWALKDSIDRKWMAQFGGAREEQGQAGGESTGDDKGVAQGEKHEEVEVSDNTGEKQSGGEGQPHATFV